MNPGAGKLSIAAIGLLVCGLLAHAAFAQAERSRPEVWEALLDAQGGEGSRTEFRATYPFSPAFVHAMVDVSGALQRERTALRN